MRNLVLCLAIGCSSPTTSPAPTDAGDTTAIDDMFAGNPDDATLRATQAIEANLTTAERARFALIDWSEITVEMLVVDAAYQHAIEVMLPVASEKVVPHADCPETRAAFTSAVVRAAGAMLRGGVSAASCSAAETEKGVPESECIGAIGVTQIREGNRYGVSLQDAYTDCLCEIAPQACPTPDGGVEPDAPSI